MRPVYGPALDVDARPAFLFQCGASDLWAVTLDESGATLPKSGSQDRWVLRTKFPLGVHEPVPVPIDPEPIIRGIGADGSYVWRQGNTSKTHGTSQ
jgi:hypothetical protein